MILGKVDETESYPDIAWLFYSSIATGLNSHVRLLPDPDPFRVSFAPHEAQLGMQANTLSSPFTR
jgi:hypothetical protein